MSATSLTVIATIKAKAGMEDEVRRELLGLIDTTRKEAGCLNYDLHVSAEAPGVFLFHENWESKKHLDEHLARPHLVGLLAKADRLFAEPPQIKLWNRIG